MIARDHGGGLDEAVSRWGGRWGEWLDLSTGINPVAYPVEEVSAQAWARLPDWGPMAALEIAARLHWRIPDEAAVIPAPGASALIARLPALVGALRLRIPGPTYNEWAAAARAAGAAVDPAREGGDPALPLVAVHPNNPDGRTWTGADLDASALALVDESFCDPTPDLSHVARTARPGTVVLKSFGKFWGLAGLRLGFAILARGPLAEALRESLGPWPISGPAMEVGGRALSDSGWAKATRARLAHDAARLDGLMAARGARVAGGTTLFRLYEVDDAPAWADRLGRARILARTFPYSATWLRLGLPPPEAWDRLEADW